MTDEDVVVELAASLAGLIQEFGALAALTVHLARLAEPLSHPRYRPSAREVRDLQEAVEGVRRFALGLEQRGRVSRANRAIERYHHQVGKLR